MLITLIRRVKDDKRIEDREKKKNSLRVLFFYLNRTFINYFH
jgi:hypothetical protein